MSQFCPVDAPEPQIQGTDLDLYRLLHHQPGVRGGRPVNIFAAAEVTSMIAGS
jgi:hypothetical protein